MLGAGRPLGLLLAVSLVAGCGLPRSGPNKGEILSGSVDRSGNALIIEVDDAVTRATTQDPALSFTTGFLNAGLTGSDTVRAGDTLSLQIWENVDDGLLSNQGQSITALDEIQVDGAGFIFVPYAGRIKAAGNTPEGIRRLITDKLSAQTPDPQVVVRRLAGDGATVSLIGGVGGQGVYPIERPTRTLTAMLAQAGGVTIAPEIAQVTVIRGAHSGRIWLEDLYENPELDIALRGGDRILVEEDRRTFTALGATGGQSRVQFTTQTISAVEAIATVGGLNPGLADPTGVFVLREEEEHIVEALTGGDVVGPQRVAYVLNLTDPNGIFIAKDFQIRDEDTVYVTEAPYSQFVKVLSAIVAPLTSVNTIDQLASGN
ncbi:polysaccharide biosynthesis/export family protein [Ovoidimarina sediminis]|uniref:polysaccharide biosynthesis/export family protein n=1 Tax=Ovoidimarina sediminis TaxID=3079856 RepID=UPI0029075849|nr:polysaccharide biosynthesis/export family protein [Rhodophyticola sp. MJ-SS7]MDU8943443.1 polysaccharide biosynthesis/export family protein [Rhodophyticola sp. MJ-SS7]